MGGIIKVLVYSFKSDQLFIKSKKGGKKSDYSLFTGWSSPTLCMSDDGENKVFKGKKRKRFNIHYFLAHYSLLNYKKGHYSLIIIPHLDPHAR